MDVKFLFVLDQKVKSAATGFNGIVTMCAVDDGGIKYFVQGRDDGQWVAQKFLLAESD